jgi:hypothetical protein
MTEKPRPWVDSKGGKFPDHRASFQPHQSQHPSASTSVLPTHKMSRDQLLKVAMHGLPGEFTQAVTERTEADTGGTLLTVLVGAGAAMNRGAFCPTVIQIICRNSMR